MDLAPATEGTRVGPDPVERVRQLLGEDAQGLTDIAVMDILSHADAMARLVVDAYLNIGAATRAA